MKTKRRYLKPWIEKVLTIITMILFMFIAMIDDFELSAIGILVGMVALLVFNVHVLSKYGKGVWLEDGEE